MKRKHGKEAVKDSIKNAFFALTIGWLMIAWLVGIIMMPKYIWEGLTSEKDQTVINVCLVCGGPCTDGFSGIGNAK